MEEEAIHLTFPVLACMKIGWTSFRVSQTLNVLSLETLAHKKSVNNANPFTPIIAIISESMKVYQIMPQTSSVPGNCCNICSTFDVP